MEIKFMGVETDVCCQEQIAIYWLGLAPHCLVEWALRTYHCRQPVRLIPVAHCICRSPIDLGQRVIEPRFVDQESCWPNNRRRQDIDPHG